MWLLIQDLNKLRDLTILGKRIPGRGNSKCKSPKAGVFTVCTKKSKGFNAAGWKE